MSWKGNFIIFLHAIHTSREIQRGREDAHLLSCKVPRAEVDAALGRGKALIFDHDLEIELLTHNRHPLLRPSNGSE